MRLSIYGLGRVYGRGQGLAGCFYSHYSQVLWLRLALHEYQRVSIIHEIGAIQKWLLFSCQLPPNSPPSLFLPSLAKYPLTISNPSEKRLKFPLRQKGGGAHPCSRTPFGQFFSIKNASFRKERGLLQFSRLQSNTFQPKFRKCRYLRAVELACISLHPTLKWIKGACAKGGVPLSPTPFFHLI